MQLIKIIGWSLGVVFTFFFFTKYFQWNSFIANLAVCDFRFIIATICAFLGTVLLRGISWSYIIKMRHADFTYFNGIRTVFLANLANFILPVRAGEVLKPYLAKRFHKVPFPDSISAIVVDRCLHSCIMAASLLLYTSAGFSIKFWHPVYSWGISVVLCVGLIIYCTGKQIFSVLDQLITRVRIPIFFQRKALIILWNKVWHLIEKVLLGMSYHHLPPSKIISLFFVYIAIITLDGTCLYMMIRAFGLEITILQGAVASSLLAFAFILPSPPAQLGAAEMFPILIFSYGLNLPADQIGTFAITWHALTLTIIFLLGIWVLLESRISLTALSKASDSFSAERQT